MTGKQNITAGFFGLTVSTVGIFVLLGWQFEIELFKRPIQGLVAMNPVTATSFVLSGLAIFLVSKKAAYNNNFWWLRKILAVIVALIGTVKLSDFFFNFHAGIDYWLFTNNFLTETAILQNRIAPTTAFNFICLGSALLLSDTESAWKKSASNYLSLLIFLVGMFSMLGYVYFVPEFKGLFAAHPMAVHTAICFLLAALAIMFINYNEGFMRVFSNSNPGGLAARVLIPGIIIFPFSLGFILLYLIHNYNISAELLVAFGVSAVILIFFSITWYVAAELNKISAKRDKAEKELSLSHERFFKFFKSSPVATNIVAISDGRFIHTNNAFLKLFSYTREQVIGKTSLDLNMVDPELRARIRQKAKEKKYSLQHVEVDLRDAHGKIKHVISSTETIEIEGELHMLNTLVDITERKEIEAEIIKNRERLNEAQKLSKIGSWDYNLITHELFWSEELYHIFELQKTPPEQLFEACRKKFHPDDLSNLDEAIKLASEKGETVVYEHRIILKNGSTRYLNGLAEIINDEEGKPLWLKGTTQDITERKEYEEKLRQNNIQLDLKNKELEQFAFIASHDLQEPLRTISSFTELLTEEYSAKMDANANTYVRFISQSANHMRDLISGLLEYSRIGNNRVLMKTDCNVILNNVLNNLYANITESGMTFNTDPLPVLIAYPLELELLFQNLVNNSIKFRKKDIRPELRITVQKKNDEWIFSFADNGIGIDPKYYEKIFLLFQRLHTRDVYKGYGIGLSHCKKIVELHNGKIWVESKPGEGSVFYFTIPELKDFGVT